jgi:DNA-binding response OmpR family regulator
MASDKILIVDDDRDFLEELQETLSLNGYDAIAVDDGIAALEVAPMVKPDLILLDIKMKGIYGFQVAERLKGSPKTSYIPIIAMTGCFTRKEDTHLMALCGMEMCLMKPFNPSELLSGIKKVLRQNLKKNNRINL